MLPRPFENRCLSIETVLGRVGDAKPVAYTLDVTHDYNRSKVQKPWARPNCEYVRCLMRFHGEGCKWARLYAGTRLEASPGSHSSRIHRSWHMSGHTTLASS